MTERWDYDERTGRWRKHRHGLSTARLSMWVVYGWVYAAMAYWAVRLLGAPAWAAFATALIVAPLAQVSMTISDSFDVQNSDR